MTLRPVQGTLPLTDECRHYDDLADVPPQLQKYWHQRYSLFNFYDYDIRFTDDAWFGVTPEPVATQVAKHITTAFSPHNPSQKPTPNPQESRPKPTTIIDLFAGVGGNTIAFALSEHWTHIIAIERDPSTLACAQHNAAVYGVPEGVITWVLGDSLDFLGRLKSTFPSPTAGQGGEGQGEGGEEGGLDERLIVDPATTVLFASPPWGGVEYRGQEVFDLETMEPYGLGVLYEACRPMACALYLPRTSDLRQVAGLVKAPEEGKGDGDGKIEVVQYCMEGASKAMVVYLPAES
ncbi:RNA cap guanine-N2 methyltransferase-domain-containing protein [Dichotomopilus funicola]|uniref:Trimethylguanosine synthase n=1 Tax=Dichotomopilus funicola TaxID=1934379 RepID=A0AAN6V6Q2_9PEZI|nr:RNA cap guanine-N2 methyltransferase-domain-containing protein [Dichotomopilus funicola]